MARREKVEKIICGSSFCGERGGRGNTRMHIHAGALDLKIFIGNVQMYEAAKAKAKNSVRPRCIIYLYLHVQVYTKCSFPGRTDVIDRSLLDFEDEPGTREEFKATICLPV